MTNAIYPGTFDPVHNGHVDVAERASKLFDTIIVAVYDSPPKTLMFSTKERVELFSGSIKHVPNIKVKPFKGLAVDSARASGAQVILRGLRAGSDFEIEFEMAHMWRKLAPDIDVVCIMSSLEHQFIRSSRIKEVASLGGNVKNLVPKRVAAELAARIKILQ
ncbi:MAG: pantetheine-phosphate adenylyltransferase [SAR202 cluster bacterium]|nr:pantetheine-phosphate adenylyltransferase [SAR202 cluster bacterium]